MHINFLCFFTKNQKFYKLLEKRTKSCYYNSKITKREQVLKIKKRLNIFIDESGDFGFVDGSSDLYAVSFTLHESSDSIKTELKYLNEKLPEKFDTGE